MPEPSLNPFSGYPAVEFEAKYPWDLHLMDADGSNVRIILSGIRFASFVKWSPQGRLLAFRGEYKDEPGIWILDTETLDVIRVWTSESFYDWSPDGKRIVIIDEAERDGGIQTYPVIIDLPSDILKTDSSR